MASQASTGGTRELQFWVADAFTPAAFAGNQAAVYCLADEAVITDAQRQRIAAEHNLSETAYITLPVRVSTPGAALGLSTLCVSGSATADAPQITPVSPHSGVAHVAAAVPAGPSQVSCLATQQECRLPPPKYT
jgi:hypothetical protein